MLIAKAALVATVERISASSARVGWDAVPSVLDIGYWRASWSGSVSPTADSASVRAHGSANEPAPAMLAMNAGNFGSLYAPEGGPAGLGNPALSASLAAPAAGAAVHLPGPAAGRRGCCGGTGARPLREAPYRC